MPRYNAVDTSFPKISHIRSHIRSHCNENVGYHIRHQNVSFRPTFWVRTHPNVLPWIHSFTLAKDHWSRKFEGWLETSPKILPYQNPYMTPKPYGLWVTADLWVMGCKSPRTNSGDRIFYGLWRVMGYEVYGLRGVRLYLLSNNSWQIMHLIADCVSHVGE